MSTSDLTSTNPAATDAAAARPGATESAAAGPVEWPAPGPGTWEFDNTHQTAPYARFHQATFVPAYSSGFAEGMAAIGSPLETLRAAVVNGWMFISPKPLGGPEEPKGGPPPRIIFEVLFRVHPELRRRLRVARSVFEDQGWVQVLARWDTVEQPRLRRRLDEAAAIDVGSLDDATLARHVETLAQLVVDCTHVHFAHAPWGSLIVGDYLARCDEVGIDGLDAMRALVGASDPVRRPTELADAIVAALRGEGGLHALSSPPDELFGSIRSVGPRSTAALDRYLDELGALIAGGGSLSDPTVGEQPGWVQTVLRSRLDPAAGDVGAEAERVVDELVERVPPGERVAWRQALHDAREIAPLRDADVYPLSEAIGRARLALREVGRRLVGRGLAVAPEDAFELEPQEVGPTLASCGVGADELRTRVAEREQQALLDPPHVLGPPAVSPPVDRFPAPIARVTRAVWAFISRFHAEGDDRSSSPGHGVSAGEVTGRAVVIHELGDLDRVEPGDIIVARTTMPTFNTVLAMSSGVVTEVGGAICHAAIMARELGIPGVVGFPGALSIPDGATVRVDGCAGTVDVLSPTPTD